MYNPKKNNVKRVIKKNFERLGICIPSHLEEDLLEEIYYESEKVHSSLHSSLQTESTFWSILYRVIRDYAKELA